MALLFPALLLPAILVAATISVWPTSSGEISLTAVWRGVADQFIRDGLLTGGYLSLFIFGAVTLVGIAGLAVRDRELAPYWPFCISFLGLMWLAYIPVLASGPLNPDESQQLTNAITWRQAGSYFSRVDGGSHGPFITMPIMIPAFLSGFTLRIDYGLSHAAGVLILAASALIPLVALRRFFSADVAIAAIVPLMTTVILFALGRNFDFIAYNAHHVCFLLMTAGLTCGALLHKAGSAARRSAWAFASGALFGAIFLAKLQWLPVVAVGVFTVAASIWLFAPAMPASS